MWKELDDAFWTVIPFGTGGRRGRMYPFGSNAINERTIGESAQGLADYYLILDEDGRPAKDEVMPYLSDNTTLSGRVETLDEWKVIYVKPNGINRIK
jgi:hypothetical protein